jgi:ribose transport system permease protein
VNQAVRILRRLPPAYPALLTLVLAAVVLRPQLLSPMLLPFILRQAAPLGIATIGQSLVMRSMSLDLSLGGVVAGVSYILTSGLLPLPGYALLLVCLAFGALIGVINGTLVVVFRASSVIVTMAMTMVLLGTVLALTQTRAPGEAPEFLRAFGRARVAGVPMPVYVWAGVLLPFALALRRTVFGRYMDAWGANQRAAHVSGIPGERVMFVSHVLCSLCAAAAGVTLLAIVGVGSMNIGQDLALNALVAAIFGGVNFGHGRGGMLGPAVGALMLTFLLNFLTSLGLGEPGRLMLEAALLAMAALAYSLRNR